MSDVYKPHPSDLWETPPEVFDPLNEIFHFEVDLCAEPSAAKCETYYTAEDDAFRHDWDRPSFMNPPYRNKARPMGDWMRRAAHQAYKWDVPIVCLVKSAPEVKWFRHIWARAKFIVFFDKRIRFLLNGQRAESARFPNALAVFGPHFPSKVGWKLTQFGAVIRAGLRGILLPAEWEKLV